MQTTLLMGMEKGKQCLIDLATKPHLLILRAPFIFYYRLTGVVSTAGDDFLAQILRIYILNNII